MKFCSKGFTVSSSVGYEGIKQILQVEASQQNGGTPAHLKRNRTDLRKPLVEPQVNSETQQIHYSDTRMILHKPVLLPPSKYQKVT